MKQRLIWILLMFSGFSNLFGQSDTYTWEEGLEVYHAKFDTQKYTSQKIDLIYDYLINTPSGLFHYGDVWHIDQLADTIIPVELDSFFNATLAIYKTIQLPEGEFWKDLLNQRKTELNEWYQAKSTFIGSFRHPEVLLDGNYPDCQNIAQSLNGSEEEILLAWKELIEKQKKTNCCPDELEKKYLVELNSESKISYAILELTIFDWWNCRNQYIHYVNDDKGIILKEFGQLFTSIEIEHLND